MKKSELKNYIRENIISTLSEDTEAEIAKTKELTAAVKDLNAAKKEAGIEESNIGLADLEEMGYEAGVEAFEMVSNAMNFKNSPDFNAYKKGFFQGFIDESSAQGLYENEDKEPSKADLKKTKGLAKAKEELAQLTKQMKSLARKYKEAEGEAKEKLVADLKKKTKLKKELEAIIDK